MKTYKGIGNLGLPGKTFFNNSKYVKDSRKEGIQKFLNAIVRYEVIR